MDDWPQAIIKRSSFQNMIRLCNRITFITNQKIYTRLPPWLWAESSEVNLLANSSCKKCIWIEIFAFIHAYFLWIYHLFNLILARTGKCKFWLDSLISTWIKSYKQLWSSDFASGKCQVQSPFALVDQVVQSFPWFSPNLA